jgi:hypothetical protein
VTLVNLNVSNEDGCLRAPDDPTIMQ